MSAAPVGCDWLLIDGSSLIFRAYYGVPAGTRAQGMPVNAIRGFLDRLARLIVERRPRRLAVADDQAWRPDWRVELIATYKSHRVAEPVPAGLEPQIPVIRELLESIGIDMVGVAEHEAEDVIATWARLAGGSVEIASGDRDLFAVVEDPRVRVLYPEKRGLSVIDEGEVTRRYGVPGRRYADFAILRGDPSDGLPGLKGVGSVTAAGMIRRYGDIAGVLRERQLRDADRAYLENAMRVVAPVADLPIVLPPGRREAYPEDETAVQTLAARYGVRESCGRLLAAVRALSLCVLVVAACALAGSQVAQARQVVIGHSVRGRPITARVLGPDSAPRKILLVGCIHGNECAGLAILSALERRPVPPGIQLWLVGELNPDGTAAGTRQNADGVDLNRNFPFQWQPVTDPTYYSGPRPLSEPETRAAVKLIRRIRPAVTIWYHQHEDLVDMAGGDRGVARRYAQLAGLRATCLPFLPGTAPGWENHTFPGTTSFVVELPAGAVGAQALARHVRAVRSVERGERVGSRTSCGS